MRITYPLNFVLTLSSRAFIWRDEYSYYEVDMEQQVIRRSFAYIHEACDMSGEPLSSYVQNLQDNNVPVDDGWLPLLTKVAS